jgi:hypothetical protein
VRPRDLPFRSNARAGSPKQRDQSFSQDETEILPAVSSFFLLSRSEPASGAVLSKVSFEIRS